MNYKDYPESLICTSHITIIQRPIRDLRVFCESHRLIAPRVCPPALLDGQAAILTLLHKIFILIPIEDFSKYQLHAIPITETGIS